jgi:hypothetical protein
MNGQRLAAIMADHDSGPTVKVQCVDCGATDKVACSHHHSDEYVLREHFPGWTARGVHGAESTLCPECQDLTNKRSRCN